MFVFCIFDPDSGGSSYYETLGDAREARARFYDPESEVAIEKLQLVDLSPRALAVRLLNGEGFVTGREVVS